MLGHLKKAYLYFAIALNVLANKDKKVLDLSERLKQKKEKDEQQSLQKELQEAIPEVDTSAPVDELSARREQKFLSEVEEKAGIWMHRFSDVRKDDKGYFILKSDNPAGSKMRVGDQLADHAINMTPYWMISGIDGERISLTPIGSNPLKSGVGAGGAKITKHDIDVYTGEYERKRVQQINEAIDAGTLDIDTFKYILLGTVPVNFGPNGAQGGWYSPTDTYSNRGGRKGMQAREIMMQDAQTLKDHGIPVPVKALDGSMDPHDWGSWVEGNGSNTTYIPRNIDKYVDFHRQMTEKGKYRYDDSSLRELYHKYSAEKLDVYFDEMLVDVKSLSPEEWKAKYPYTDQDTASVMQVYKWAQQKQEKAKREAVEYLTEGESEEFEAILKNVFSKERRVANRNVSMLIEMCKEDMSYVKYLHDIINLGGASDYLANEQVIKFFNLIDDVEGLKLCAQKLKDSDNIRYALSYLFQQGEEEFALSKAGQTDDLQVINSLLSNMSMQYSDSEERKKTFGRNQKLMEFVKKNNIVDKLKAIDVNDSYQKHFAGEIISQIRRSFGPDFLWEVGDEELLDQLNQLKQ
jgi:hypothetical protein